jgi:hypothetical protein
MRRLVPAETVQPMPSVRALRPREGEWLRVNPAEVRLAMRHVATCSDSQRCTSHRRDAARCDAARRNAARL